MGGTERPDEQLLTVVHDLRTPLAIISAYAQRLEETGLGDEERAMLIATIRRNVERMASLIDRLLAPGPASQ